MSRAYDVRERARVAVGRLMFYYPVSCCCFRCETRRRRFRVVLFIHENEKYMVRGVVRNQRTSRSSGLTYVSVQRRDALALPAAQHEFSRL